LRRNVRHAPDGSPVTETRPTGRDDAITGGVLVGLGLGGFVDGIVLHQILQWHHMLTDYGDYDRFPAGHRGRSGGQQSLGRPLPCGYVGAHHRGPRDLDRGSPSWSVADPSRARRLAAHGVGPLQPRRRDHRPSPGHAPPRPGRRCRAAVVGSRLPCPRCRARRLRPGAVARSTERAGDARPQRPRSVR
jgi:Predicted membrane protein (DUF2243)